MANSGTKIGQFTDELEQATTSVAKDVKDQVGQAIEQGLQSITGKQSPQQLQQQQLEDQKKLLQARKKIKWYQDVALAQKKVREDEKQKQLEKKQIEEEEKRQKRLKEEEEKKKVIISPAKKTPQFPGQPQPIPEEIARSKQEIGKGHGIGG